MIARDDPVDWHHWAPFRCSFLLLPLLRFAAAQGNYNWSVLSVPAVTWYLFAALARATGVDTDNADPATSERDPKVYKPLAVTWVPVQFATIFSTIW